ncbi:MAG: hypothetical protein MZW92_02760 [Comamonadaceae bacterium]|nr:hypothetical protein [Comamonadaceae bacterium]
MNGIDVFGKGADYIPEDNLLGRTNKAKTHALLSAAKAANHNMVRVWGGGVVSVRRILRRLRRTRSARLAGFDVRLRRL